MPEDISSSSSSDETNDATPKSPVKRKKTGKNTKYQCPPDFVSFCHKPCSSTLTESLNNKRNELWLIKAPASCNPECFSGIKVPLIGLQNLKVPAGEGGASTWSGQQIYSVLASTHGTADLCLLTSDKQSSDGMVLGPTFSGLLNVCESYGDSCTEQVPHVIPAAPAPSLPPGLKQRFYPFGTKTPMLTGGSGIEMDGATLQSSSTPLVPLQGKQCLEEAWQEEEGRKKKKKKKEKRIKTEREAGSLEVVNVKVESVAEIQDEMMMELPLQKGDGLKEKGKRRKKKKKRDRDSEPEELEESMETTVKVEEVKIEPIDILYGDAVDGSLKKKKKKKSKSNDD